MKIFLLLFPIAVGLVACSSTPHGYHRNYIMSEASPMEVETPPRDNSL